MLGLSGSAAPARTVDSRRAPWVFAGAVIVAALSGVLAGSNPALVIVPLLMAVPVILWKRPHWSVIFLLAACTEIEQWGYTVGTHTGTFTSQIPFFRTFTHGMILLPAEIFVVLAVLIWVLKSGLERKINLPKSMVMRTLTALWVLLIVALAVGLSRGAHLKIALWELRPWLFLSLAYLLTAALMRTRKAFDTILWTLVLGSGFKGVQGTWIFFAYARQMRPRPAEILSHEEAFFLGLYLVVFVGLWLWGLRGGLRTTATILFPFVLIADMANSRRVAWLILMGAMVGLFAVGLKTLPERRKFLVRTLVAGSVAAAVYLPAFWNHDNGTLGQPARAVRSVISPDPRDKSSNLYRYEEDANLVLTIKASGKLGAGFGTPIMYSLPIANITGIDSMISYIPHDGLLWVWMRMGLQGEIVFWCFVSAAIVKASRLAKSADRQVSLLGAVIVCALIAYVLMGHEDMGFAWIRIAGAMGCLLGTLEAASKYATENSIPEVEAPARRRLPPRPPAVWERNGLAEASR